MTQDERIERYFSGEMDDLERIDFDKEVMNNPILAAAVKEYRALVMGIKTFGLQQQLNDVMSEEQLDEGDEDIQPSTFRFRWWHLIGVAIFIGGLYFLSQFGQSRPESHENLHIAYYYQDPGLPTTMGVEEDFNFSKGMVAYKSGNYKQALNTWESLPKDKEDKIPYYIAMAHMGLKKNNAALEILEKINNSSPYYAKALWYRSMIKLNQETERLQLKT